VTAAAPSPWQTSAPWFFHAPQSLGPQLEANCGGLWLGKYLRCPDGTVYCVASGPLCRLQWEQAGGSQLCARPHLQESAWCYERKRGWYWPHDSFLSYLVVDPESPSGQCYLTKRWRDRYEGARGGRPQSRE